MELPAIEQLRAFDAVARHRSFRRAADELHLTASAVSHRIKQLEMAVGQALLIRSTRHVALTGAGETFRRTVGEILAALAAACDELRSAGRSVVTIMTTDSVATCWLIDRLPSITADLTGVEVRVLTRPAGFIFDDMSADLAIVYGQAHDWPGNTPLVLAPEVIRPVGTPHLIADIHDVGDLWRQPLLADDNLLVDWPHFARHSGATDDAISALNIVGSFNHSHLALRAAALGHGIALASSPLADDAVQRGELAYLLDLTLCSERGYHLIISRARHTTLTHVVYDAFARYRAEREAGRNSGMVP